VTILDTILDQKQREVAAAKARIGEAAMARMARQMTKPVRSFRRALLESERPRVIAEIKRRSPSRGEIRPDFDPVACAKSYAEAGAAALSVLTDQHFFGGSLELLDLVRRAVELPLLRKDFLIDPYQVEEARAAGADAVLLIVRAVAAPLLAEMRRRAQELGLDALVEVHDERELEVALQAGADLIGINHRDLRTFETDLGVSERLAPRVPASVVLVAESGIFTYEDVVRLEKAGAHAVLVGESLMREPDVGRALRQLRRQS